MYLKNAPETDSKEAKQAIGFTKSKLDDIEIHV